MPIRNSILRFSSPRRGKKMKLLSPDMISPPLGDFRHKSHIGQNGENDMFGEIPFLKDRGDLLFPCRSELDLSVEDAPPKPPRLHLEDSLGVQPQKEMSKSMSDLDNIDKPSLSWNHARGHGDELPGGNPRPTADRKRGADIEKRMTICTGSFLETKLLSNEMETLPPLNLDLGPSILDDILKIMDSHKF
nr:PREDICTED: cdc42 effector protein 2-like [Latimeria chalumnae]|eukprot:XP_005990835.1 PREDICTED: cdc42 effector protein 2-like [Latimeria chalumnae]